MIVSLFSLSPGPSPSRRAHTAVMHNARKQFVFYFRFLRHHYEIPGDQSHDFAKNYNLTPFLETTNSPLKNHPHPFLSKHQPHMHTTKHAYAFLRINSNHTFAQPMSVLTLRHNLIRNIKRKLELDYDMKPQDTPIQTPPSLHLLPWTPPSLSISPTPGTQTSITHFPGNFVNCLTVPHDTRGPNRTTPDGMCQ